MKKNSFWTSSLIYLLIYWVMEMKPREKLRGKTYYLVELLITSDI